jgi:hypothetical protein
LWVFRANAKMDKVEYMDLLKKHANQEVRQ